MKFKRVCRGIGIAAGCIVAAAAGVLTYYTVREYRPDEVESIRPAGGERALKQGEELSILTYNTGYAGLDRSADFFMDGGTKVNPKSRAKVEENLAGIAETLQQYPAAIYCLQEVDFDSARTFGIDEQAYYEEALGLSGMAALNYKCDFVPYPLPPIGKVESGLVTISEYQVSQANRISLPVPFSWPARTCNLKRCLLETRIPVEGTDKELVFYNLHLEAYDNGEGKAAQSRMLAELLEKEYEKGNYVIAGGDFNQTFEQVSKYPIQNTQYWVPGTISKEDLPEGFSFAVADNYPTCRLLNAPYTGDYETSQTYVIDGFIVSPNVKVKSVEVINVDFEYTDHQPVYLSAVLG